MGILVVVVGEEVGVYVSSCRLLVVGGPEVIVFEVKEGEGYSCGAASVGMLGFVLAKRRWSMLRLWRRWKKLWLCMLAYGGELATGVLVEGCTGSRMRRVWLLRQEDSARVP